MNKKQYYASTIRDRISMGNKPPEEPMEKQKAEPKIEAPQKTEIYEKQQPKLKPLNKAETPTELELPSYLMAPPFTYSIDNPNNVWMDGKEPIDYDRALKQWHDLYSFLVSAGSLVYLLPSGGNYQDQIFVANLGITLPHLEQPTVVLSKYASEPRMGEEDVGKSFFDTWNLYNKKKYDIVMSPIAWEGEAELKWLHGNVYAGGYGTKEWSRTEKEVYKWFDSTFGMKTIQINMTDEKLYHFDCMCFPLTSEKTMLCTAICTSQEIKEMEKETEIIDISKADAYEGATNCVRVHNSICVASDICQLKENTKEYKDEREMVENLEHVCTENGLELVVIDMSEMGKGGAALSCNVMHMNKASQCEELL